MVNATIGPRPDTTCWGMRMDCPNSYAYSIAMKAESHHKPLKSVKGSIPNVRNIYVLCMRCFHHPQMVGSRFQLCAVFSFPPFLRPPSSLLLSSSDPITEKLRSTSSWSRHVRVPSEIVNPDNAHCRAQRLCNLQEGSRIPRTHSEDCKLGLFKVRNRATLATHTRLAVCDPKT
jgi:hypothetical protein